MSHCDPALTLLGGRAAPLSRWIRGWVATEQPLLPNPGYGRTPTHSTPHRGKPRWLPWPRKSLPTIRPAHGMPKPSPHAVTWRTGLLQERADRAGLRGVQGIDDGAGQTKQHVHTRLITLGDQRTGAGQRRGRDGQHDVFFDRGHHQGLHRLSGAKPRIAVTSRTRPPITKRHSGAEGRPAAGPRRQHPRAAVPQRAWRPAQVLDPWPTEAARLRPRSQTLPTAPLRNPVARLKASVRPHRW